MTRVGLWLAVPTGRTGRRTSGRAGGLGGGEQWSVEFGERERMLWLLTEKERTVVAGGSYRATGGGKKERKKEKKLSPSAPCAQRTPRRGVLGSGLSAQRLREKEEEDGRGRSEEEEEGEPAEPKRRGLVRSGCFL